jgi:BON domain-containing protein
MTMNEGGGNGPQPWQSPAEASEAPDQNELRVLPRARWRERRDFGPFPPGSSVHTSRWPAPADRHEGRWIEGSGLEEGGTYQQGHGYGVFDDDVFDGPPYRQTARVSRAPGRPSQRGRGPRGASRTDQRIREQVCEALTVRDDVDASDVEVSVRDGDVLLCGTVPEHAMKRAAELAAERCRGVTHVQNSMRVRRDRVVSSDTAPTSVLSQK